MAHDYSSSDEFLCDYEKERLENIRKNQDMLKYLGLPVKNGRREVKKKKKIKKLYCVSNTSNSDDDDEWKPWMSPQHTKQKHRGTSKLAPISLTERIEMLKQVDEQVDQCILEVMDARKKGVKLTLHKRILHPKPTLSRSEPCSPLPECFTCISEDEDFWGFPMKFSEETINTSYDYILDERGRELFKGDSNDEPFNGFTPLQVSSSSIPPCCYLNRYSLRKHGTSIYTEDEVSDEDEYLFCDDCNSSHRGDCPIHGPLKELNGSYDYDSLSYTQLPVPVELTVKCSDIPDAGLGVFATQFIPRGVKVGPYEGKRITREALGDLHNTAYVWEIRHEEETPYFIDGQDPAHSNWLRFVNCARHEDEQNMVSYQYHGCIYYRSFKNIYPGTELLVWYGDQYARDLGISLLHEDIRSGNYTCLACGANFVEKKSFYIHLRYSAYCSTANPLSYTCGICTQTFNQQTLLQEHLKKHNNYSSTTDTGEPYKCERCGKSFSQSSHLQKHILIHTGDKPYKCEHCGKSFNRSSHLQQHIRIHTGDKPYKCEHCGKSFSWSSYLQRHIRIHTGDKPYKCEHCGKSFSRSGSLQQHIRIHTGDKPYKCEHCGKSFSRSDSLQQHIWIHTGDKPYKCEHCGKSFSRSSDLQRHIRIHTGDKPYKCEHCGKSFNRSGNLHKHILIHTGDKPYKCEHCGKSFISSNSLGVHICK